MPLTTEQIAAVNDSLTQPIIDAIVGVLTAEPYSITPEAATAAAQEYTGAGSDALIAYFSGADTGEAETAETEMEGEKSLNTKAGARISASTSEKLSKAIEAMATIKQCAKIAENTIKELLDSSTTSDDGKGLKDEVEALKIEVRALKSAQEDVFSLDEFIAKKLQ